MRSSRCLNALCPIEVDYYPHSTTHRAEEEVTAGYLAICPCLIKSLNVPDLCDTIRYLFI